MISAKRGRGRPSKALHVPSCPPVPEGEIEDIPPAKRGRARPNKALHVQSCLVVPEGKIADEPPAKRGRARPNKALEAASAEPPVAGGPVRCTMAGESTPGALPVAGPSDRCTREAMEQEEDQEQEEAGADPSASAGRPLVEPQAAVAGVLEVERATSRSRSRDGRGRPREVLTLVEVASAVPDFGGRVAEYLWSPLPVGKKTQLLVSMRDCIDHRSLSKRANTMLEQRCLGRNDSGVRHASTIVPSFLCCLRASDALHLCFVVGVKERRRVVKSELGLEPEAPNGLKLQIDEICGVLQRMIPNSWKSARRLQTAETNEYDKRAAQSAAASYRSKQEARQLEEVKRDMSARAQEILGKRR